LLPGSALADIATILDILTGRHANTDRWEHSLPDVVPAPAVVSQSNKHASSERRPLPISITGAGDDDSPRSRRGGISNHDSGQLRADSHREAAGYFKFDANSAAFSRFEFDGTTGAEIAGNIITLHFVDGERGDADGQVNGTSINYTPAANFFGTETFTYTISDGTPQSTDTATVTMTVTQVLVRPGQNVYQFTAADGAFGQTATTSLTLEGFEPSDAIDYTILADVSASIAGEYGRTSFNDRVDLLYADVAIHNMGQYLIDTPLLVGVINISEPTVRVHDPDGIATLATLNPQLSTTTSGIPYYDFSKLAADGTLSPGELTGVRSLEFFNPDRIQFTYDLVVLGVLNRPPFFTSVPKVSGIVAKPYSYDSDATDPDADTLTYTLLTGAAGMEIDSGTGELAWTPTAGDVGNHSVSIRVKGGRGGSDVQSFVISVTDPPPNRPPVWTSTPIVEAYVNIQYAYPGTATDPDQDTLTFSKVTFPQDLDIDPSTGLVMWVPRDIGTYDVVLKVDDGRGGFDLQPYTILVQQQPGNHPPVIVSTPII
jgi:hypothetical protein